jgi:ribosomal subunit interface protein
MTNLPIQIIPHHCHLSPALHDFVLTKIAAVTRVARDILSAEIVVRRRSGRAHGFCASARLALPGRDIYGKAKSADPYNAVGKLIKKLARLARKRKTRLGKTFEHAGRSRTPSEAPSMPFDPETERHAVNVKRRPRVREDGQETRVFPFRRQEMSAR